MCWKNSKFDPITGSPKCSQLIPRGTWTTWNTFQPAVVETFLWKAQIGMLHLATGAKTVCWSKDNWQIFWYSINHLNTFLSKTVKHILQFEDTLLLFYLFYYFMLLFVIRDNKWRVFRFRVVGWKIEAMWGRDLGFWEMVVSFNELQIIKRWGSGTYIKVKR